MIEDLQIDPEHKMLELFSLVGGGEYCARVKFIQARL